MANEDVAYVQWNIVVVQLLDHVQLFVTLWTIDSQASLCKEFPRQEYWSGLPFSYRGDLPAPGSNLHFLLDKRILHHWVTWEWNGVFQWNITGMEYYSAKKKKRERENISPFTATWMNLESIMLCEMSDRKTNTIWSHLYIESKKQNENIQIQRIFGCQKGGHLWGCKIGEED